MLGNTPKISGRDSNLSNSGFSAGIDYNNSLSKINIAK